MSETEPVWSHKDLLHMIKLDEELGSFTFIVNKDETDVRVIINGGDLFYWACGEAEEFTMADLPDFEQCVADLEAVEPEYGRFSAAELFFCRRATMRPQGAWYGYMDRNGMVFRRFVPKAIEAVFDAAGPERDNADGKDGDGPKRPRPADGRRWDRGGSKTPEDNPPEFLAMFQEGGQFGP